MKVRSLIGSNCVQPNINGQGPKLRELQQIQDGV